MASEEKLAQLQAAFSKFDADGSGFISREEMRAAVVKVCEGLEISEEDAIKEADELIKDSNEAGEADNKISFDEFVKLMSKN